MTRAEELKKQIAQLEDKLHNLPGLDIHETSYLARLSGVSSTTVRRAKKGDWRMQLSSAKKLLPFMNKCPCCGQAKDKS